MQAGEGKPRSQLTLALAQIATCPGQLQRNLQVHLEMVERACQAGAELVVFPELSLTGYWLGHGVLELALDAKDPRLAPLLHASKNISILLGLPWREAHGGVANAAVLLEGGQVVDLHRKLYLPTYGMFDEGRYFVPGRALAPLSSRLGKLGVLICEDAWHPACATILARAGAELLLVMAGGPSEVGEDPIPAGMKRWHWIVGATAITTVTPTFFANRCGWEEGILFSGGSLGLDGRGQTLAGPASPTQPELVVGTVDLVAARRYRSLSPIPGAERLELWRQEVEKAHA